MVKKKSNHGGARPGAGRKPANALTCPMCSILARQLELAGEREKVLLKQLGVKDAQIGTVIDSKFETIRVSNQPLPEVDRPAMPLEQLTDVDQTSDEEFLNTVSRMAN